MKRKRAIKWQAGFTKRGLCVVILIVAVICGVFGPRYVGQFENTRAMGMQAMLINVLIAQTIYHAKTGDYTDVWENILPYVDKPEILEVQLKPVTGQPQKYFIGFGKNAAAKQNGYFVSLQLNEDKKSGQITAMRSKNWFYGYELKIDFPDGKLQCIAQKRATHFCAKLLQALDNLELQPLLPAQNAEPAEK